MMSFDRGTAIAAEPAPAPRVTEGTTASEVTPAMRLQILSTEHWSLLASRSLAWNESFSRAGMFLTTLTGAIVALALVAQASPLGDGFTLFALVILPIVLFIGVTTMMRLGASNYHEAKCVVGMNRIRAAYLELAPDLERYFVMSAHDDAQGIGITMGVPSGGAMYWVGQMLAGTPTVVMVLNSVLAGVITAVAAVRFGVAVSSEVLIFGVLGFLAATLLQILYARSTIAKGISEYRPLFPTPAEDR
jgi:hypothetical protein